MKMRVKRTPYAAALFVCSLYTWGGIGAPPAEAADTVEKKQAEPEKTIKLADTYVRPDYVEIEKLRDTKQIIVITKKAIEEKGYKTISDILKDQPSISVGASGWGNIDIRGQGDQSERNLQVLIDGAPVTTMVNHPLPNNYDYVPVEQIEKIEIIPGGGSIIYGSGAAGGIINITTNLRSMNKPQRTLTTEWNSDGYRMSLNYGDKVGDKLTLQGGYSRLQRDLYFVDTYRNSNYAFAGLRYDADADHSVTFRYSHLNEASKFLQNLNRSKIERDGRHHRPASAADYLNGDRDFDTYNLTYHQNLSERLKFSGDFFYTDGWYKNTRLLDGKMKHDSYGARMKFDYAYGKQDSLLIGIDWIRQSSDLKYQSGRKQQSFQYNKETQALYLLNQMKRDKFTFTQGIRREKLIWDFDKDGGTKRRPIGGKDSSNRWNTAAELSVAYQYGPVGRVFARWERGFTSPDGLQICDQVYSDPYQQVYKATTAEEEKYHLYEIGMRDKIGISAVSLTLFATETSNELNRPYFFGPYGPEYKTYNMFNTKRHGIELSLQQRLGKLELTEGYTYLHGERRYTAKGRALVDEHGADAIDFTNSGLQYVPQHKALLQANYTFDKKWSAALKYTFFGGYNNFVKESDKHDPNNSMTSYGLLDISFKFKQNQDLEWYGGVTNVFDKLYYETAGFGMYTLIPGMPRTYFIGAKYAF